jgi:hypothetical protein
MGMPGLKASLAYVSVPQFLPNWGSDGTNVYPRTQWLPLMELVRVGFKSGFLTES